MAGTSFFQLKLEDMPVQKVLHCPTITVFQEFSDRLHLGQLKCLIIGVQTVILIGEAQ